MCNAQLDIAHKTVQVEQQKLRKKKLQVEMTKICIETKNLSFSYNRREKVLSSVNMQVPHGAIYGLLGSNGSGKSTLFKLILHLLKADTGDIFYWGEKTWTSEILNKIGSIVGEDSYYPHLTVRNHLELLDIFFHKGKDKIDEVLECMNILHISSHKASKLSTGQRRRLSIAMALFRNPELLILDEPFNGLDFPGVIDLRKLLLDLHSKGKTIIISNHMISELEKICTHAGIINAGHIVYQENISPNTDLEEIFINAIKNDIV